MTATTAFPSGWTSQRLAEATAWSLARSEGFLDGYAAAWRGEASPPWERPSGPRWHWTEDQAAWSDVELDADQARAMGFFEGHATAASVEGQDARAWTKDQMEEEARFHEGYAGKDHFPAEEAEWEHVAELEVSRILHLMPGGREAWLSWFREECLDAMRDGRSGYGDLIVEDIREPVVLVDAGEGRLDCWDGWHRMAATVLKGGATIQAILGTRKPEFVPTGGPFRP